MARCRKCNAEVPDGKELCAQCEQLNKESYLDSLLHSVASDDEIAQGAKNGKRLRRERMKKKKTPSTAERKNPADKRAGTAANAVVPEADSERKKEPEELAGNASQGQMPGEGMDVETFSTVDGSLSPDSEEILNGVSAAGDDLPEMDAAPASKFETKSESDAEDFFSPNISQSGTGLEAESEFAEELTPLDMPEGVIDITDTTDVTDATEYIEMENPDTGILDRETEAAEFASAKEDAEGKEISEESEAAEFLSGEEDAEETAMDLLSPKENAEEIKIDHLSENEREEEIAADAFKAEGNAADIFSEEENVADPAADIFPEEGNATDSIADILPEEGNFADSTVDIIPEEGNLADSVADILPEEGNVADSVADIFPEEENATDPAADIFPEEEDATDPATDILPEEGNATDLAADILPEEGNLADSTADILPEGEIATDSANITDHFDREETVEEVIKEFLGEPSKEITGQLPEEDTGLETAMAQDTAPEILPDEGGRTITEEFDNEGLPSETKTIQAADSMERMEENQNDPYRPEAEEAWGFDLADGFDDGEEKGYDILGDDTASDDEFDRMLKEISDTENAILPETEEEAALVEDDEAAEIAAISENVDDAEMALYENVDFADSAVLPEDVDDGERMDLPKEIDAQELPDVGTGGETENAENPALAGELDENLIHTEPDMDSDVLFPLDGTQGEEAPIPDSMDMFPMPEDVEDNINNSTSEVEEMEIPGEKENSMAEKNEDENLEFNEGGETQEDILNLINSIYSSEEGASSDEAESVPEPQFGTEDDLEMSGQDDMTDFFADVLPDEEFPTIEEAVETPKMEEEDSEKKKKKDKKKEKNKKPNIFKRVFGNIRPERTEEEVAQMKEKVIADAEAKEAAEEDKKKKAAAEKEAKKKKAADDKAAAAKKKQENAKKKAEAAKAKKEAKKEAKDKKKQEVQNLIDEIDENEGKINRVGAAIVFVFFAVVAVAIIIGTKTYAYSQNLENAQKSFEFKHYDEAYEEIAGINVKEEDEAFVLQVMIVMYTNKQLNSFNRYYAVGLYPEALDSLLKGLDRYDKYTALAAVTGVTEDLDLLKKEILDKLDTIYSVSEKEAMDLNSMSDHTAYTEKVYEIAGKIVPEPANDTDTAEAE